MLLDTAACLAIRANPLIGLTLVNATARTKTAANPRSAAEFN